jgi:hypothetical protein
MLLLGSFGIQSLILLVACADLLLGNWVFLLDFHRVTSLAVPAGHCSSSTANVFTILFFSAVAAQV